MIGKGKMSKQHQRVARPSRAHIPVLLNEMLQALSPKIGGRYVDGTFGGGGYSRAILQAADCAVIALDRDPNAHPAAAMLAAAEPDRFQFIEGCFGDMCAHLPAADDDAINGVILDLGVSSMQIDEAARGFSFRHDGPLDMRMSQSGESAEDLLNDASTDLLADIIAVYGEEHRAKAIARAIEKRRKQNRLTRTSELADIICTVLGAPRPKQNHPATRTFQALRIYLNDELGELMRGLLAAEKLLAPGGRLVVISFHSLEDRMVKHFIATRSGRAARPSRHLPETEQAAPSFTNPLRKPLMASAGELAANPRTRSAKLRLAERTHAAPILASSILGSDLLPPQSKNSQVANLRATKIGRA